MAAIDLVLSRLADRKLSRSGDSGKQWTALCPAHADSTPSLAVAIGSSGVVLTCYAGCPTTAILSALGLSWPDLYDNPEKLTRADLASYKRLPDSWLAKECGLTDLEENGSVGIPVKDLAGVNKFMRRRIKLHGSPHTVQPKGVPTQAYGQWRLKDARKAGELVIVEGESDCWTLWYHGFTALGLPGAKAFKKLLSEHVEGISRLYVWQEHGEAGAEFVKGVVRRLGLANRIPKVVSSEKWKDPSALHLADPDGFPAAFREILANAHDTDVLGGGRRGVIIPGVIREQSPPAPSPDAPTPGYFGLTDLGNSQRLVRRHGPSIRWVKSWEGWLAWDGKFWITDASAEVMQRAFDTSISIWHEASVAQDAQLRQQLGDHAKTSESRRALEGMIALARSQPGMEISHKEINKSAWLLGCPNGTLDLKTGEIRGHRKEDIITKRCATVYNPEAVCQEWEAFLRGIFTGHDAELVPYIQRLLGYCLSGDVSKHLLAVFWGCGGNGKGTLLNTFLKVVGEDYAGAAPSELLMMHRGDRHPVEIANLFGKRLVVCQETDDGCRLNEPLVKWLTGGDELTARRMRENYWQFTPTHKLILSTNYRPNVKGTDRGIWRRLRLIPFEQTFDGDAEDAALPEKLLGEAQGILAWAVRGCMAWVRDGERVPDVVKVETDKYRVEEDVVQQFVREQCLTASEDAKVASLDTQASTLYAVFRDWLEKSGERKFLSQYRFAMRMKDLGNLFAFSKLKDNTMKYQGIILRPTEAKKTTPDDNKNGSNGMHRKDLSVTDLSNLDD